MWIRSRKNSETSNELPEYPVFGTRVKYQFFLIRYLSRVPNTDPVLEKKNFKLTFKKWALLWGLCPRVKHAQNRGFWVFRIGYLTGVLNLKNLKKFTFSTRLNIRFFKGGVLEVNFWNEKKKAKGTPFGLFQKSYC